MDFIGRMYYLSNVQWMILWYWYYLNRIEGYHIYLNSAKSWNKQTFLIFIENGLT